MYLFSDNAFGNNYLKRSNLCFKLFFLGGWEGQKIIHHSNFNSNKYNNIEILQFMETVFKSLKCPFVARNRYVSIYLAGVNSSSLSFTVITKLLKFNSPFKERSVTWCITYELPFRGQNLMESFGNTSSSITCNCFILGFAVDTATVLFF